MVFSIEIGWKNRLGDLRGFQIGMQELQIEIIPEHAVANPVRVRAGKRG
jgi:hypothetical protein